MAKNDEYRVAYLIVLDLVSTFEGYSIDLEQVRSFMDTTLQLVQTLSEDQSQLT